MTPYNKRLNPERRRALILKAALKLAKRIQYNNMTREKIAKAARVSDSLVSHYFGTVHDLNDELMKLAVDKEHIWLLAQGLARKDPRLDNLCPRLRDRAYKRIIAGEF